MRKISLSFLGKIIIFLVGFGLAISINSLVVFGSGEEELELVSPEISPFEDEDLPNASGFEELSNAVSPGGEIYDEITGAQSDIDPNNLDLLEFQEVRPLMDQLRVGGGAADQNSGDQDGGVSVYNSDTGPPIKMLVAPNTNTSDLPGDESGALFGMGVNLPADMSPGVFFEGDQAGLVTDASQAGLMVRNIGEGDQAIGILSQGNNTGTLIDGDAQIGLFAASSLYSSNAPEGEVGEVGGYFESESVAGDEGIGILAEGQIGVLGSGPNFGVMGQLKNDPNVWGAMGLPGTSSGNGFYTPVDAKVGENLSIGPKDLKYGNNLRIEGEVFGSGEEGSLLEAWGITFLGDVEWKTFVAGNLLIDSLVNATVLFSVTDNVVVEVPELGRGEDEAGVDLRGAAIVTSKFDASTINGTGGHLEIEVYNETLQIEKDLKVNDGKLAANRIGLFYHRSSEVKQGTAQVDCESGVDDVINPQLIACGGHVIDGGGLEYAKRVEVGGVDNCEAKTSMFGAQVQVFAYCFDPMRVAEISDLVPDISSPSENPFANHDIDQDGVLDLNDNCVNDVNPTQEDADGDGWGAACDCDDNNAAAHPGVVVDDECDGIDNDCDGLVDEDDPNCVSEEICDNGLDDDGDGDIDFWDAECPCADVIELTPDPNYQAVGQQALITKAMERVCENGIIKLDGEFIVKDVFSIAQKSFTLTSLDPITRSGTIMAIDNFNTDPQLPAHTLFNTLISDNNVTIQIEGIIFDANDNEFMHSVVRLGGWGIPGPRDNTMIFSNNVIKNNKGSGVAIEFNSKAKSNQIFLTYNEIFDNVISNNGGIDGGAGITISNQDNQNSDNDIYVLNNSIHNNSALDNPGHSGRGGAISVVAVGDLNISIVNNLIYENTATAYGGGIYFQGSGHRSEHYIFNNTLEGNDTINSGVTGGGIYIDSMGDSSTGNGKVANNLITGSSNGGAIRKFFDVDSLYNNAFDNNDGKNIHYNSNWIDDVSTYQDQHNGDNYLCSPDYQADYRLSDSSDCIDGGDRSLWDDWDLVPGTVALEDLDGNLRIACDSVDPGAYELQACAAVCTDEDGDGFTDAACGGDDCDDSDWNIKPGINENCLDNIDNDCDGNIDCDDSYCYLLTTYCNDDDGDNMPDLIDNCLPEDCDEYCPDVGDCDCRLSNGTVDSANENQWDSDCDGIGNKCDPCPGSDCDCEGSNQNSCDNYSAPEDCPDRDCQDIDNNLRANCGTA